MAIPISQLVCAGMALVTIGYSVGLAIHLFRQKNKTFDIAFDDTVERLRTLSALAIKLQQSEGQERKAACRQAVGLVREDCRILFYLVHNFALDRPPKDEKIHKLAVTASSEVRQVYLMTYWIFFLLRFYPPLLKDCHRVREVMWRHGQAWLAYLQLLRAQYPAEWGHVDVPD
jgi:hypothetical protein